MASAKDMGLKTVQPYIKVAEDFRKKDPVVAYYCDLHAMETGMSAKSDPNVKTFLIKLMGSLETQKTSLEQVPDKKEILSAPVVAFTHVENQAKKLFTYADSQDRSSIFNKKVVRAFYTSALLFDVAEGISSEDFDEESRQQRKYARWKATYIHNCLKNGETPEPGPIGGLEDSWNDELGEGTSSNLSSGANTITGGVTDHNTVFDMPKPAARTKPAQPAQPAPQVTSQPAAPYSPPASSDTDLTPLQFNQAQKLSKYASSAIMCQDVPTAILYLEKCLNLLKTGKEDP